MPFLACFNLHPKYLSLLCLLCLIDLEQPTKARHLLRAMVTIQNAQQVQQQELESENRLLLSSHEETENEAQDKEADDTGEAAKSRTPVEKELPNEDGISSHGKK